MYRERDVLGLIVGDDYVPIYKRLDPHLHPLLMPKYLEYRS
jgi:hypothetical protein